MFISRLFPELVISPGNLDPVRPTPWLQSIDRRNHAPKRGSRHERYGVLQIVGDSGGTNRRGAPSTAIRMGAARGGTIKGRHGNENSSQHQSVDPQTQTAKEVAENP